MNKYIKDKVKDLVSTCHEDGLVVCVGVADKNTGESIRSMDGKLSDVIILVATLIIQLSTKTEYETTELISAISQIIKEYNDN